jgi:3-hydroxyisobutyrate dehydrogenase
MTTEARMIPGAPIGFVGLGIMGLPMATNLVRAGADVLAWSRRAEPAAALAAVGGRTVPALDAVFSEARTIILMLRDEPAVDDVLGRGSASFGRRVRGRTIVQMGTFAPTFSRAIADEVHAADGRYVEAPVSGSHGPAVERALIAMLAGDDDAVAEIEPIVDAMCAASYRCGAIPSALATKVAVNAFLITMVTGLAESFHIAARTGVDPDVLRAVLDAGPMSSPVSRSKTATLRDDDLAAQASIADVLKNARLVEDAAEAVGAAHPLTRESRRLYEAALAAGRGEEDMIGVISSFR